MSGLKRNRRTSVRLVARIAAAVLTAGAGFTAFAGVAGAAAPGGGASGTIKVDGTTLGGGSDNNPHQACGISIEFFGFAPDAATAPPAKDWTGSATFTAVAPTGSSGVSASTASPSGFDGAAGNALNHSMVYTLDTATLVAHGKQGYHINVSATATRTSDGATVTKSKVIWVGACPGPQNLSLSGACNHTTGMFDWTVTTSPATAALSVGYTDGATNNSTTTDATGAGAFSTVANSTSVSATGWTGDTKNVAGVCTVNGKSLSLSGSCSNGSYSWTVSTTPSTGSVTVSWSSGAGAGTVTTGAGGTGGFTSSTNSASASATGWTGASKTVTACGGAQPGDLTVNGTCSNGTYSWTATTAPVTPGVPVSWTSGSQSSSATTGTNGQAVFTSTSNSAAVSATGWNGANKTITACRAPSAGQADPSVTSSKHCVAGISVVLGDLNGTADVSFTVTSPNGKTHQVAVRQGQLVKKSYAVEEDSTGVVTVDAPGMAKQTIRYAKDCSTVLGEKHVRHVPKTQPRAELPFTGFESRRAAMLATALLLVGAALCGLGSIGPRRRTV